MAAKKKRNTPTPEPSPSLLDSIIGGGIALLCVATPLVSSEGSPERGAELWLAVAWCLLLVLWGARALAQPTLVIRWSWVESLLIGFLVWLALSTWMVAGEGNLRAAFNGFWDHAHLLIAYFLIRQWIVTDRLRHALLTGMIGVAVLISAFSIYQYRVILPANVAAYEANPDQLLIENGIDPAPDNPVRTLFESRLRSTEPTGMFTLTNSLAGFLVPWLLLSIGWLKNSLAAPIDWKRVAGLAVGILFMGTCLLLTKSRTAWLATLLGLGLIGLYGSAVGRRVSWRIPVIGMSDLLGLFMLSFAIGVLDVEVLSEAPKSVVYRLQYWQGAAEIVAHHPFFGCGLGNFQGYYPQFMLPMASETVADPHNFVFEIWAAAGTPALFLFLAAMVAWAREVALARNTSAASADPGLLEESSPSDRPILLGAIMAPFFAPFLQMIMQEVQLDFTPLIVGIIPALFVGAVVAKTPITRDLRLWLAIAAAVLVVNLLAAGGISFPSVAGSLYLLAAVALPSQKVIVWEDTKLKSVPLVVALVGLLVVIYLGIQPVTARKTDMALAMTAAQRADYNTMKEYAEAAAVADPWSKDGPLTLANVYFQSWINSPQAPAQVRQEYLNRFESALDDVFQRAGNSFPLHESAGNWWLDIYRQSNNPDHILSAVDHYQDAARLYPNRAMHHAQLAWALHLANIPAESVQEADEALRLDELNPHEERKLSRLKIHDVPRGPAAQDQPSPPDTKLSAKQVMENLRTME